MTKVGCVETREEALKTGALFREAGVRGVVISAVNFGDEQGVATALQAAGIDCPVLIAGA